MHISTRCVSASLRCSALAVCLLALPPAFSADDAMLCPAPTKWADAARVVTNAGEPAVRIVIQRYADAGYVAITIEGTEKALLSLSGGIQAVKVDADSGPMSFLGLDMVAGAPLARLATAFPQPCLIPEGRELALDLGAAVNRKGPAEEIKGWVKRSAASISYAIKVRAAGGAGGAFAGTWEFVPVLPRIPENTSLIGWKLFHPNGTPIDTSTEGAIDSVGTLLARYPEGAPRQ